jgi:hypothetical protein
MRSFALVSMIEEGSEGDARKNLRNVALGASSYMKTIGIGNVDRKCFNHWSIVVMTYPIREGHFQPGNSGHGGRHWSLDGMRCCCGFA